MVYSEKENLNTDLENVIFIAHSGILGIQLGLFMALTKKKDSTVQMRTREKQPENAILLWNMDEIIADKTLWHKKVSLRHKGVWKQAEVPVDGLFWLCKSQKETSRKTG